MQVITTIDPERCTGCGLCVRICPADTLSMVGDHAEVTGDESLQCGHCAAVCPVGAITVGDLTFPEVVPADVLANAPPVDLPSLVRLMQSRRSCRAYNNAPVAEQTLRDLVGIGITAPSGTNSQQWSFTILPTRADVVRLGELMARFFRRLNALAAIPPARLASRVFGGDALGAYFRNHRHRVVQALAEWDDAGVDRLFHGAPAVILVGSRPGASTPYDDALLATSHILLAAEAMGLGTCLIGYAVEAVRHDPRIAADLGLPADEPVYAVIAVGHPAVRYRTTTGRREPVVRIITGQG